MADARRPPSTGRSNRPIGSGIHGGAEPSLRESDGMPPPVSSSAALPQTRVRRRVEGIAAALLPYDADGRPAAAEFAEHLRRTHNAGLQNAVNMDTGYANLLTDSEQDQVLRWTADALGPGVHFVAGAFVEGRDGSLESLYGRAMDRIQAVGGTPILFQTTRMHALGPAEKVDLYARLCRGRGRVLGFELGRMFAPNGEIWEEDVFRGLLEIPELVGAKHSSLSMSLEARRLALRDAVRPQFRLYTGNDLGIRMTEFGSDYLLGLATFHPEAFAARDRMWEAGDIRFLALSEALQYLGHVAFRDPVPAYKHSAAHYLHLRGLLSLPVCHPRAPVRPAWEPEILSDCLRRIEAALPME